MVPTQQRLEPDDPSRVERDDRLVHELELVVGERAGEVGFELQAFHGDAAHLRVVHEPARLAGRLGAVHGDVGVAEQRGGGDVDAADRDADRCGDRHRLGGEHDRCRQRDEDPLGDDLGLVEWVGALLDEDRELVAAEPGHGVAGSDGFDEAPCDLVQEHVAGRVAETVVDGLETVEVQEQHDGAGGGAGVAMQGVLDAVDEQRTVGEIGETVVERLMGERRLDVLAGGDVVQVHDDTADVRIVDEVHHPCAEPLRLAGAVEHSQVGRERLARSAHTTREHRPGAADVVGCDRPERVLADGRGTRMADQLRQPWGGMQERAVGAQHSDRVRRVGGERGGEPFL